MVFKELTELELVTGTRVQGHSAHTHTYTHKTYTCTHTLHGLNVRELIVAAASCFFTKLSHSLREASGCLPSQGGLQYLLWVGVEARAMCQSILII